MTSTDKKPRKVKSWNLHYISAAAGWARMGAFVQDEDWYLIGCSMNPNVVGQLMVYKGISEHADVTKTDVYFEGPYGPTGNTEWNICFLPPGHAFFISEDEQVVVDYFAAGAGETGNVTLYYIDANEY